MMILNVESSHERVPGFLSLYLLLSNGSVMIMTEFTKIFNAKTVFHFNGLPKEYHNATQCINVPCHATPTVIIVNTVIALKLSNRFCAM